MRIVERTSLFPAPRGAVYYKIQQLQTLQYIARPCATFKPVPARAGFRWTPGSVGSYRLRLFGVIPFGTHTIHILEFNENVIRSREGNEHVPVWNHTIRMEAADAQHTRYTDHVEIEAGWKTPFVFLWAKCFYRHRQRRWIRLLNRTRDAAP